MTNKATLSRSDVFDTASNTWSKNLVIISHLPTLIPRSHLLPCPVRLLLLSRSSRSGPHDRLGWTSRPRVLEKLIPARSVRRTRPTEEKAGRLPSESDDYALGWIRLAEERAIRQGEVTHRFGELPQRLWATSLWRLLV